MAGARVPLTRAAATMLKKEEHDATVARLYEVEYGRLIRLARLLVPDPGGADDVVREALARLHARRPRLRERQVSRVTT